MQWLDPSESRMPPSRRVRGSSRSKMGKKLFRTTSAYLLMKDSKRMVSGPCMTPRYHQTYTCKSMVSVLKFLFLAKVSIYIDPDGIIYDASLNRTNIGDNNNKVMLASSYASLCATDRTSSIAFSFLRTRATETATSPIIVGDEWANSVRPRRWDRSRWMMPSKTSTRNSKPRRSRLGGQR
jgi:hypothetical protein